jgi:hypothetical protein
MEGYLNLLLSKLLVLTETLNNQLLANSTAVDVPHINLSELVKRTKWVNVL